MNAVVAGATGLVGSACVRALLAAGDRVTALVRRPAGGPAPELPVDYERLHEVQFEADAVFCALGTTIRKAGSQEAFRKVDFEYPLALARRSVELGVRQFVLVTSVDSSVSSPTFYLRVKGELEREMSALPFEAVHIFRPSFLVGERQEPRALEKLGIYAAQAIRFALGGKLRKYRPIEAAQVAAAMARAARSGSLGVRIYHYDDMAGPV